MPLTTIPLGICANNSNGHITNAKIKGYVNGTVSDFTAKGNMKDTYYNGTITNGMLHSTGFNATLTGQLISSTIDMWMQGTLDPQTLTLNDGFKKFMINLMDDYMKMGLAGDAFFTGMDPTFKFNAGVTNVACDFTLDDVIDGTLHYRDQITNDVNQTIYSILTGTEIKTATNGNLSVNASVYDMAERTINATVDNMIDETLTIKIDTYKPHREPLWLYGLIGALGGELAAAGMYEGRRFKKGKDGIKSLIDQATHEESEARITGLISSVFGNDADLKGLSSAANAKTNGKKKAL